MGLGFEGALGTLDPQLSLVQLSPKNQHAPD
jgi:hypothetical protein